MAKGKTKRQVEAETLEAELDAELKRLEVLAKMRDLGIGIHEDDEQHTYTFTREVDDDSVRHCLEVLTRWHDEDPEAAWTLVINSVGGSVFAGNHLLDHLINWSVRGGGTHHVTTLVRGAACSMAATLTQAGDDRIMGSNSLMLIHEGSWGTIGTYGQMKDDLGAFEKMCALDVELWTSRATISADAFVAGFHRRDWWLTAKECLDFGFIDQIG